MVISISKRSNNTINFKENHSMETKIKYAQQFNSFSTVLPGGGFHGGEQTDVLPGDNSNGDEKYGQATFTQKA